MRLALVVSFAASLAAALPAFAQTPAAGADWRRLQQLPKGTRLHVAADAKTRLCNLDQVTDDALTCSKGRLLGAAHYTFARAEIKSIKLTRYTVSTLAGAGIGAGVAGAISLATIRGGTFIDFSGPARAVITVAGGVLGAAATGPADAFRGPTLYRRP